MNKVYITHATKTYLRVAHNLAKSIREFSELPIVIYCVDTEIKDTYIFQDIKDVFVEILILGIKEPEEYNVNESGNIYVDRKNLRTYDVLSAKINAIKHALDSGWDEVCYLDSDCLATPLVDEIFGWSSNLDDYPLATRGIYEYMIVFENEKSMGNPFTDSGFDAKLCLEWPLMNLMCIEPAERGVYKTTNVILTNQNCRKFVNVWLDFCKLLPNITDLTRITPFHEETVFNALTWRKQSSSLPLCYINISHGLDTVKDFYTTEENLGNLRHYNEEDYRTHFYKIPNDKRDIKVLHGEKVTAESDRIISYLKELKENGYFKHQ
jgi:hypothetical protein